MALPISIWYLLKRSSVSLFVAATGNRTGSDFGPMTGSHIPCSVSAYIVKLRKWSSRIPKPKKSLSISCFSASGGVVELNLMGLGTFWDTPHSCTISHPKYLDNYMTWFAYIDTTRSISRGIWEQRFLAMSCIDSKKVRYKSSVPTGACVICNEPILLGEDVGSVFFVSHEMGEREPDQLCHSACYHGLGSKKSIAS